MPNESTRTLLSLCAMWDISYFWSYQNTKSRNKHVFYANFVKNLVKLKAQMKNRSNLSDVLAKIDKERVKKRNRSLR